MSTRFTVRAVLRALACTLVTFALFFSAQTAVALYQAHEFLVWIEEVSQ